SIGGLTRFTGVQGGSAAGAAWTDLGTGLQNLASYAYNDPAGFASAIAVDPFINAYDRYADIYNNDGLAAMMGTMATDGLVKGILEGPTRGIGIDIPAVTKKGSAGNTSGSGSSQGSQSANNAGDFSTPPFEAGNPALDVAEGTKGLKEQAADLVPLNNGKHRVTLRSEKQQLEIDLAGKDHAGIPTPHTKVSSRNTQAPEYLQPAYNTSNKSSTTQASTQEEIRAARKYLEKQDR
ncbi:hypothetical protein QE250_16945, partial [Chromatiaceae bacterium AAb-1]|nr:hypothetical protein [Chromatiaceae bacterium AAb-1]